MNFRQLIDQQARYNDKALKPRSIGAMAEKCGVSRAHLYNYFTGAKRAPEWTVEKMARGLELPAKTVEDALAQSRKEARENA
jgi:hypothetical protein